MKDRAVFCTCWEPNEFLGVWVRHYGRWFDADSMFVVPIKECVVPPYPVTVLDRTRPSALFSHTYEQVVRNAVAAELLQTHRAVICADMDEIVFHEHKPLDQFLAEFVASGEPVARCQGVELLDFNEGPLDWSRPILGQRAFYRRDLVYDKPCVVTQPTDWHPGTHVFSGMRPGFRPTEGLYLAHLNRADYDLCRRNVERAKDLNWEKKDAGHDAGWSTRPFAGSKFREYYWRAGGGELFRKLAVVPDHWRGFA